MPSNVYISTLHWIFRYRMVIRPKAVRWGVPWSAVEDSKLLVGLYEHGMGNWLDIKQNKPLGLQDKVRFLLSKYHLCEG